MKAAVLGSPISHSLSPILHNSAYRALGLTHTYSAIEVSEQDFPVFISNLQEDWLGVSLTMPLKEVAFQVATSTDLVADQTGVINTLVFSNGVAGYNTDVAGIVDALTEHGVTRATSGLIFGAGATARSALVALHKLGITRVECIARNNAAVAVLKTLGESLKIEFSHVDLEASQWLRSDVVINTTPVGSLNEVAAQVWQPKGILLDVVYDPWPTQLAAAWGVTGGSIISGLSMLLHQAAHQVSLMTASPAPITQMRTALNEELLARGLTTI